MIQENSDLEEKVKALEEEKAALSRENLEMKKNVLQSNLSQGQKEAADLTLEGKI